MHSSTLYLPPGTLLDGKYEIIRVLGHGGFGITYLTLDHGLEQEVALKEYLPDACAAREAGGLRVLPYAGASHVNDFRWGLGQFIREARVLAGLRHSSLVRVMNTFEAHGTAYIAMEFIDGPTLEAAALIGATCLPWPRVWSIGLGLSRALVEVHGARYLHGDISPRNVLIGPEGDAILIDFGSARAMVAGRSQNMQSTLTTGYAPFECYSSTGQRHPSSDLYALAATLCFCITGKVPCEAPERLAATSRGRHDPVNIMLDAMTEVPPAARSLLASALAVLPGDRWPDVMSWSQQWATLGPDPHESLVISADERRENARLSFRRQVLAVTALVAVSGAVTSIWIGAPREPVVITHAEDDALLSGISDRCWREATVAGRWAALSAIEWQPDTRLDSTRAAAAECILALRETNGIDRVVSVSQGDPVVFEGDTRTATHRVDFPHANGCDGQGAEHIIAIRAGHDQRMTAIIRTIPGEGSDAGRDDWQPVGWILDPGRERTPPGDAAHRSGEGEVRLETSIVHEWTFLVIDGCRQGDGGRYRVTLEFAAAQSDGADRDDGWEPSDGARSFP